MSQRGKQLSLFVLCALVLLSAGYGWGYVAAYTSYYSVSSVLDRETLDLDFNSRLLHFANANQPDSVRARLLQRLAQEVHYVDQILSVSQSREMAQDAAGSLERARLALSEPRNLGSLAAQRPPPVQTH